MKQIAFYIDDPIKCMNIHSNLIKTLNKAKTPYKNCRLYVEIPSKNIRIFFANSQRNDDMRGYIFSAVLVFQDKGNFNVGLFLPTTGIYKLEDLLN